MLSIYREKIRTYPRGAFVTSDVRRSGGTLSLRNAVNFMSAFLALLVTKNANFMKMRNLRFENEEALSEKVWNQLFPSLNFFTNEPANEVEISILSARERQSLSSSPGDCVY